MANQADRIVDLPAPQDMKQLRACLFCSQVRSWDQFEKEGCPNCDSFLHLQGNKHKIGECTSASFEGLIALMDPDASWVARWQRISGITYTLGLYAMNVNGRLPREVAEDIESKYGKKYIPRSQ